jgi:hypothetical protein
MYFKVMNVDNFKVFCINAIFLIGIFGRLLSGMALNGVDNTLKLDIYGKYWNRSDADARRYVHGIRNPSHYYLA